MKHVSDGDLRASPEKRGKAVFSPRVIIATGQSRVNCRQKEEGGREEEKKDAPLHFAATA